MCRTCFRNFEGNDYAKHEDTFFSGLLAILGPMAVFSQVPSKTAQSGTAKLQAKVDFETGEAQVEFDSKKITPEKIVAAFNQAI